MKKAVCMVMVVFVLMMLVIVPVQAVSLPKIEITSINGENHTFLELNTDGVNLRTGPGTSYTSLGLMYMPCTCLLLDQENDNNGNLWVKVQEKNMEGRIGWAMARFFNR